MDGVTKATVQGYTGPGLSETRSLNIGSVRKFRVCFEIDRSWNDNATFNDRPAFTYRSGTIDLDDLESQYDLALYGWMSNEDPDQAPKSGIKIDGWDVWEFLKEISWLAPNNDMVSTLRVVVAPK